MAYRVDISPSALQDAEDAYLWIKERAPDRAGDWYEGLLETIFSLEELPMRCSIAPESEDIGIRIRQIFYGKGHHRYRILFTIGYDEKTDEDVVRIYRIWSSSRGNIRIAEIARGEAESDDDK